MAIHLSERAAKRIRGQLARRGRGIGLRLGIREAGCSGYAYVVDYADAVGPDDVVFEDRGVKIVVHRDHVAFLDGLQVDYRQEGLNAAFQFHNPKARATCGCGESFAV